MRSFALIAFLGLLMLALARPAAAGIPVTLSADTPAYNGPCPVAIHFTGTISSTLAVTYQFVRSDGTSTAPTLVQNPAKHPDITDSWVVNASGAYWDEVHILSPAPPEYSQKANMTVTCVGKPGPTPTPKQTPTPKPTATPKPKGQAIAPPYALDDTKSPQVCADRFGAPLFAGVICGAAISHNMLVLIWKWDPNACGNGNSCITNIDGYRLYQVGKAGELGPPVTNQQQFAVAPPNISRTMSKGMCFYIVAYAGNKTSANSNTHCSNGDAPLKTVSFTPSNMVNTAFYHHEEWDGFPCGLHTGGIGAIYQQDAWATQEIVAGWTEWHHGGPCWEWETSTYRGAWKFDLGSLAGKTASKATMTFKLDASHPQFGVPISCADGLYTPTANWVGLSFSHHVPVGDLFDSVTPGAGSTVTEDVTNRVNLWLHGNLANNGFAMKGPMEDLTQQGNAECTTIYGHFKLSVTYFNT
jgi:hypothetical protein